MNAQKFKKFFTNCVPETGRPRALWVMCALAPPKDGTSAGGRKPPPGPVRAGFHVWELHNAQVPETHLSQTAGRLALPEQVWLFLVPTAGCLPSSLRSFLPCEWSPSLVQILIKDMH